MKEEMKNIDIYARGIIACSVCAPKDMSREEVELQVNMKNPTGIDSKWTITRDDFADGAENPYVCDRSTEKLHYLLHC